MNVKAVWKRWLDQNKPTGLQIYQHYLASRKQDTEQPLPPRKSARERLIDFIHYQKYLRLRKDPNYQPITGYGKAPKVGYCNNHIPPPPRPEPDADGGNGEL